MGGALSSIKETMESGSIIALKVKLNGNYHYLSTKEKPRRNTDPEDTSVLLREKCELWERFKITIHEDESHVISLQNSAGGYLSPKGVGQTGWVFRPELDHSGRLQVGVVEVRDSFVTRVRLHARVEDQLIPLRLNGHEVWEFQMIGAKLKMHSGSLIALRTQVRGNSQYLSTTDLRVNTANDTIGTSVNLKFVEHCGVEERFQIKIHEYSALNDHLVISLQNSAGGYLSPTKGEDGWVFRPDCGVWEKLVVEIKGMRDNFITRVALRSKKSLNPLIVEGISVWEIAVANSRLSMRSGSAVSLRTIGPQFISTIDPPRTDSARDETSVDLKNHCQVWERFKITIHEYSHWIDHFVISLQNSAGGYLSPKGVGQTGWVFRPELGHWERLQVEVVEVRDSLVTRVRLHARVKNQLIPLILEGIDVWEIAGGDSKMNLENLSVVALRTKTASGNSRFISTIDPPRTDSARDETSVDLKNHCQVWERFKITIHEEDPCRDHFVISLQNSAGGYLSPKGVGQTGWVFRPELGHWERLQVEVVEVRNSFVTRVRLHARVKNQLIPLILEGIDVWEIMMVDIPALSMSEISYSISNIHEAYTLEDVQPAVKSFALKVMRAMKEVGAFSIVEHGISRDLFELSPQSMEQLTYLDGPITDDGTAKDSKILIKEENNQITNVYPSVSRDLVLTTFSNLNKLTEFLLHVLVLAVGAVPGAPEVLWRNAWDQSKTASIFLLLYNPGPALVDGERVLTTFQHTDSTWLTLLTTDNSGGLEIYSKALNEWVSGSVVEGGILVNAGNVLSQRSSEVLSQRSAYGYPFYDAVCHRVARTERTQSHIRVSMPFFFGQKGGKTGGCHV